MCRLVKLVGEDHSQVLMVLHKDDGLSLDFRGEARIEVGRWGWGGGGGQEHCFRVSKSSVPRRSPVLSCRDGCSEAEEVVIDVWCMHCVLNKGFVSIDVRTKSCFVKKVVYKAPKKNSPKI